MGFLNLVAPSLSNRATRAANKPYISSDSDEVLVLVMNLKCVDIVPKREKEERKNQFVSMRILSTIPQLCSNVNLRSHTLSNPIFTKHPGAGLIDPIPTVNV